MSDAGRDPRVVPVYALTRGRTASAGGDLPWEALVTATGRGKASLPRLRWERARIVALCEQPVSVVEVGSELGVPVGVARVLVGDLVSDGLLEVRRPALTEDGRPSEEVLERLIAGLRSWA